MEKKDVPSVFLSGSNPFSVREMTALSDEDNLYGMGAYLAQAILLSETFDHSSRFCILSSHVDADSIAKGVYEHFLADSRQTKFSCMLNNIVKVSDQSSPIAIIHGKFYQPGVEGSDELVAVHSGLQPVCVLISNMMEAINRLRPKRVHIAVPMLYADMEKKIKSEFPSQIFERMTFHFIESSSSDMPVNSSWTTEKSYWPEVVTDLLKGGSC